MKFLIERCKYIYIGRCSEPAHRFFGTVAGLRRGSTLKPHAKHYQNMVIACCASVLDINKLERNMISAAAVLCEQHHYGCIPHNASAGGDGPICADVQFLYMRFTPWEGQAANICSFVGLHLDTQRTPIRLQLII